MSAWLKSPDLCGCFFAAITAAKQRILPITTWEPFSEALVQGLNADFESAARNKRFALAIFPLINTEVQLNDLIEILAGNDRWKAEELERQPGHMLLELRWTNAQGTGCNAVGFAPTLSMPASRRAPYVAMGVWPCGHDNQFLTRPGKTIGLADTYHDLDEAVYKHRLHQTEAKVGELIGSDYTKTQMRKLTFRVSLS